MGDQKSEIESDIPWWVIANNNPNFTRFKMAVERGAVMVDKDEIKVLPVG